MKKALLLMWAFVMGIVAGFAQTATFDFTNPTGLNPSVTPAEDMSKGVAVSDQAFTDGGVTFVATKGTNDAMVWTTTSYANELRVYKNATITLSASSPITKIVFNKGSKFAISTTTGTLTGTEWTGSATSVEFSVTGTTILNSVTVTLGTGEGEGEGGEGEGGEGEGGEGEGNPAAKGTGTAADPFNSVAANLYASSLASGQNSPAEVYIKGKVVSVKEQFGTQYGNASFYISDDGTSTDQFYVYRALYLGNQKYTSCTLLNVGDEVVVCGLVTNYMGNTPETVQGKAYVVSINGKTEAGEGGGDTPDPVTPESYSSLAALKAAATAEAVAVKFNFTNLLVTGVAGKSVYVTDGTEGFLLYCSADATYTKGDLLSGTLQGDLKNYYNTIELMNLSDFSGVTVVSSGKSVEPQAVSIATLMGDTNYAFQSKYVKLSDVLMGAESLVSRQVTLTDDDDNTINIYDTHNKLAAEAFNTEFPYDVCGYVGYRSNVPVIYIVSADDLTIKTTLKDAETAWAAQSEVVTYADGVEVVNFATTASDAPITYTSSNEAVATVDAAGHITVHAPGITVITATTAQTAAYLEGVASFNLYVRSNGDGTVGNPYQTVDAIVLNDAIGTEYVWVKGTIMGIISNTSTGAYSKIEDLEADKIVNTNLAVGDGKNYLPVQLPTGVVRTALNLKDNPDNQGKTVWLYGQLVKYFGLPGIKNIKDYSFDGSPVTAIHEVTTSDRNSSAIYTLDGVRQSKAVKGFNIISGKKVIVK